MSGAQGMDRWILGLFLLATALFGRGHLRLEIDMENAAMRSVGTPQSESIRLREAEFGMSIQLAMALEASGRASVAEQDRWSQGLLAFAELGEMMELPSKLPQLRLWSVELKAPADGRYASTASGFESLARMSLPAGCALLVAGLPVAETVIADALARENRTIVPLLLGTLFVALFLIYRSPALAVGGLLPSVAGVLWIGGLQKALGLKLDPISTLLAPTLLAIGVATSVHVLEKYRSQLLSGQDRNEASRTAARRLLRPTLLTVITTLAGFLGLAANAMPAVHRFGYLAALGIGLTSGFSLSILPIWLRCFHRGSVQPRSQVAGFQRMFGWVRCRPRALLVAGLILATCMGWGWSRLRVDTDPLLVLAAEHPYRIASDRITKAMGAVGSFEVLFEPSAGASEMQVFDRMQRVLSLDEDILGPGGAPQRSDSGLFRWPFLLSVAGTAKQEACFDRVETSLAGLGLKRAFVSGALVQIARDSGELVRGQLRGLGFTLFCLWLTMAIGFRSVRLGFLGLIPNVLPCLVLYGSIAILDRPLSVVSAMIGSVMLGVIVDDTIHLIDRFCWARAAAEEMAALPQAVALALVSVGRPILITSVVLFLGFGSAVLGTLETTKEFAMLAASTVLLALAADLILLPAALLVFGPAASKRKPREPGVEARWKPESTGELAIAFQPRRPEDGLQNG